MSRFVFVYGTLRAGERNDIARFKPSARFVGNASVRGRLYDCRRYPGAILDPAAKPIYGELYEVESTVEAQLDDLEIHFPPNPDEFFKREVNAVLQGSPTPCFVYEYNPVYLPGKALIASGDWVSWRTSRE